jgi:SagB-type dehydrogenase family enzyme
LFIYFIINIQIRDEILNIEKTFDLLKKILEDSSDDLRRFFYEGVKRSYEKKDLTMIYHYISMLSPDYYGTDLFYTSDGYYKSYPNNPRISLPKPLEKAGTDLFEVIRSRRSRRRYSRKPLTLDEISTLLYYTVGITGRTWWGGPKRVYPSAGALQPVEAYLVALNIKDLSQGIYHYNPGEHVLERLKEGDYGKILGEIALDQEHVSEASANIILTIVYRRTASKYGLRAYKYALLDTGFAGQNIYLVAEALGLATVAVGAFYDKELCRLLEIDCEEEIPTLIFPIGRRS